MPGKESIYEKSKF